MNLPADWPWQVGQRLLAAAQSCGFTCERAFQVDAREAPLCCDPCQLTIRVVPEFRRRGTECGYHDVADIDIMLDTCRVPGGPEYDWTKVNAQSQVTMMAQAQIIQGIKSYLAGTNEGFSFQEAMVDPIAISCRNVEGAAWRYLGEETNCVRWGLSLTAILS